MIVRSYSGRSVAEALEKVRTDLGPNALIIETRSCKLPGLLGKHIGYEVVAAGDAGDDGATPASMSDNEAPALRTIDRSCNQQRRPATLPIDMEPHRDLRDELLRRILDESVARGLEDVKAGRVRPADEMFDELRRELAKPRPEPARWQKIAR